MEWSPDRWAPIIVVDQRSVDQLNAMMERGWVIGTGDARLPLLIFPRRLSEPTGLSPTVRGMIEEEGGEEILTRTPDAREQRVVLTPLPGEAMDYRYVTDLIGRSHPGWHNLITVSLGSRSTLTVLERHKASP